MAPVWLDSELLSSPLPSCLACWFSKCSLVEIWKQGGSCLICFRGEICSSKVDHCLLHWDDADFEQVDAEDDDEQGDAQYDADGDADLPKECKAKLSNGGKGVSPKLQTVSEAQVVFCTHRPDDDSGDDDGDTYHDNDSRQQGWQGCYQLAVSVHFDNGG